MRESALNDIEAERCVIAAVIADNEQIDVLRNIVTEADFTHQDAKAIFGAYLRMRDAGETFTPHTVPVGCEAFAETCDLGISARHAGKIYAERLRRASRRRKLRDMAYELALDCETDRIVSDGDSAAWFTHWQEKLIVATSTTRAKASARMSEVVKEVFAQLEENQRTKGELRGASMGIATFDEITRGMRRSDTHIISARAGMGKTALMINVLRGAAMGGARTLVYSYEMKPSMLVQRMFTSQARVSGTRADAGMLQDDDMKKLANAMTLLAPLQIWFEEHGTISDIRATAIEQHRTQGLDLLIVDHVGLVDAIGRSPSREREVAEISRGLKGIARSLNIPVLVLAQLNRNADPSQEPSLSELRESGSLEQDASVVFMLWANEENEKSNQVQWKLAKNRHGPANRKGMLNFYRDTQLITDNAPRPARQSLTDEANKIAQWGKLP